MCVCFCVCLFLHLQYQEIPLSLQNQHKFLWNLKHMLLRSKWVDPTYQCPLEPSSAPLEPFYVSLSTKSTKIFIKLETLDSGFPMGWSKSPWPYTLVFLSIIWSLCRSLMSLSLSNQLEYLWNFHFNILLCHLLDPNYPGHPLCFISTHLNPLELLLNPFMPLSLPNLLWSLWNLIFWGPYWLIQLLLAQASVL